MEENKIEVEITVKREKSTLQKVFTSLWLLWLLAFIVIEAIAVFSPKKGDTLSEHVWEWFDIKVGLGEKPRKLLRFVLLSFMSWLTVHFLTGGAY